MTITAKFAGTCRVCCKPIKPGSKIEWKKGEGSTHVECVGKTPEPLNSPPPAQLISADTDLAEAAAKFGRSLSGEPKIVHISAQVHRGQHCEAIGSIIEYRGKRLLVLAHTKPQYLSADYLEDMDMFDRRPGLWYEMSCVAVAPTAGEQASDAAKQAAKDKAATEDARRRAITEQVRQAAHSMPSRDVFPANLQDCWGRRGVAGHDVTMSDGIDIVLVSESSYDDFPRSWMVRDAKLAREAIGLKQSIR